MKHPCNFSVERRGEEKEEEKYFNSKSMEEEAKCNRKQTKVISLMKLAGMGVNFFGHFWSYWLNIIAQSHDSPLLFKY
jgi:hypothetical protein